jgi:signal transduction histidine kinase
MVRKVCELEGDKEADPLQKMLDRSIEFKITTVNHNKNPASLTSSVLHGTTAIDVSAHGDIENGITPAKARKEKQVSNTKEENPIVDEDDDETMSEASNPSCSSSSLGSCTACKALWLSIFIFMIGLISSSAFLAIGITGARRDEADSFDRRASELVIEIIDAWADYEVAGLWIHEACRGRDFTRLKFRELSQYLHASGLEFQAAEFIINATREERASLEEEARQYYANRYPHIDYQGFLGFEPDPSNDPDAPALSVQPRSEQAFYFPVHYVEPVEGNEAAIDFDLYSSASRRETISEAMYTWEPALTARLRLVQETDPHAFSVLLMHPGVNLTTVPQPRDVSLMVIRIPDLLKRASRGVVETASVFLYDTTDTSLDPQFLGGTTIRRVHGESVLKSLPKLQLNSILNGNSRHRVQSIKIASRQWEIAVVAVEGTFQPDLFFVILGGIMIFIVCTVLSIWVYTSMRRTGKMNAMRSQANAEKAAIIIKTATKTARAERELNDFIAHEVRNPLAAAISACSFVSAAVDAEETKSLVQEQRRAVQEDIAIIDCSLRFINDLLRNMLDMQRAATNQLKIELSLTDLLKDVFEPVDAMLYRRGDGEFKVLFECPPNLIVMTDRLRLKQILMNLGRNSIKFVNKGFIRFRAVVVEDNVHIYVEDSGPGIPSEKREILFSKFQDSLDSLAQGTGIGLCLVQNLLDLMNGTISLDETYDSEVLGYPGTRFFIDLNVKPSELDESRFEMNNLHSEDQQRNQNSGDTPPMSEQDAKTEVLPSQELPEELSVLFVDDDLILRKLFSRSLKKCSPGWKIQEAANGESALKMVDLESFDLIFMDQYMASVEKQLLGTETVRAMRSKGITSRICGLSANDVEKSFLEAGADSFMFKPFPCGSALAQKLRSVLYQDHKG